jgi:hypothetical protein
VVLDEIHGVAYTAVAGMTPPFGGATPPPGRWGPVITDRPFAWVDRSRCAKCFSTSALIIWETGSARAGATGKYVRWLAEFRAQASWDSLARARSSMGADA